MRRALAFLTPLGGAAPPTPAAVVWFPAVGALIGVAVGGVWWGAAEIWPAAVAAALAVAADLGFTGLLHVDGLADTADGLLPPLERERRLEVMSDPGAGAFAVAVVVVTLLLRWAAFAVLQPSVWLVAGLWCASRTVMAMALRLLPYARPRGLATPFRTGPPSLADAALLAIYGPSLAVALAVAAGAAGGLGAVMATVAGGGLVLWLARRRIGGFTGDVLGAAGIVGETLGLLVAAARW